MMSTFPTVLSSDYFFGNPFPAFEGGFTPWDSHDQPFPFPPQEEEEVLVSPQLPQEPVNSNSGSDNRAPVTPNSCSDEPNRNSSKNVSSSSEETSRLGANAIINERKRRRMLSNRESARRSRMRKQKHLENMRTLANRFKIGNRELMNQVRLMIHQNQFVRRENDRLRSEENMLRQRLWDIRQVLLVRQLQQHLNPSAWPCNNITSTMQSLIT
ncbi:basic leucine-zipper 6 [Forsythia ovata]|uniref:Basic leucine-zipper 6 n=1 Tax=Forsythia ovata TaxID=205694 RepID=A0ABD1UD21_9LAMI